MAGRIRLWIHTILWFTGSLVATVAIPWVLRYAFFDRVPAALLAADFSVTEKAVRTAAGLFQMVVALGMMGAFLAAQAIVNSLFSARQILSLYQLLDKVSDSVAQLADIARQHTELIAAGSPNTAEVAALLGSLEARLETHRRELTEETLRKIAATEDRLRGEWRFVAGLLPTVIIAAMGVIISLFFGLVMMFKR